MKRSVICLFLLCFCQAVSAEKTLTYGETESIDSKALDLLSTVAVVDAISNAIPELIVIGVDSKGPELRPPTNIDGSVNTRGEKFKSFFIEELLPHIKQTYRVARFSILSGHSNSGRFVLNTFLDDPRLFNAYFAFSPSLDDGVINQRVMKNVSAFTDGNSILFMTLANEGQHMQVPFRELVSLFDQPGSSLTRSYSTQFFHREFPEQSHASTKIVSLLFSLKALFDGWQPDDKVQGEGLPGLQGHYAGLTERYGFEVQIPLHFMLRIAYFYSAADDEEKNKKAAEVVKFALHRDPASINDFVELIEALNNQGEEQGAQRLTAFVCNTMTQHTFCSKAQK